MTRIDGAAPANEPYKSSNNGAPEENETSIFSYQEGYNKTIGYVAAHDGGKNSTLLDGKDVENMITMLSSKYNEYKNRLSAEVINKIKETIANLRDTKKTADKKYLQSLIKIQQNPNGDISKKLKNIRTADTCEYYIDLLNEMYDDAWEIAQLGNGDEAKKAYTEARAISDLRGAMEVRLDIITGKRNEDGSINPEKYFDDGY